MVFNRIFNSINSIRKSIKKEREIIIEHEEELENINAILQKIAGIEIKTIEDLNGILEDISKIERILRNSDITGRNIYYFINDLRDKHRILEKLIKKVEDYNSKLNKLNQQQEQKIKEIKKIYNEIIKNIEKFKEDIQKEFHNLLTTIEKERGILLKEEDIERLLLEEEYREIKDNIEVLREIEGYSKSVGTILGNLDHIDRTLENFVKHVDNLLAVGSYNAYSYLENVKHEIANTIGLLRQNLNELKSILQEIQFLIEEDKKIEELLNKYIEILNKQKEHIEKFKKKIESIVNELKDLKKILTKEDHDVFAEIKEIEQLINIYESIKQNPENVGDFINRINDIHSRIKGENKKYIVAMYNKINKKINNIENKLKEIHTDTEIYKVIDGFIKIFKKEYGQLIGLYERYFVTFKEWEKSIGERRKDNIYYNSIERLIDTLNKIKLELERIERNDKHFENELNILINKLSF